MFKGLLAYTNIENTIITTNNPSIPRNNVQMSSSDPMNNKNLLLLPKPITERLDDI